MVLCAAELRRGARKLKTVILHLGTHKAASTSVQLFLAQNRQTLSAEGVCYPIAPEPTGFAHHGMPWVYIRQHTGAANRPGNYTIDDALSAFRSSGCHTLLLSSEDFLNCTDYEGFLTEFEATLRRDFDKIIVTAFVRDRKGFFSSSYNEWVKSLVYTHDFKFYLNRVTKGGRAPIHYTRSLLSWAKIADSAVYTPFLPSGFSKSVEHTFLAKLGFPDATIEKFEPFSHAPVNMSIGPKAVLAYRRLKLQLEQLEWFDPYKLQQREVLTNFLQAYTDKQGWNQERFRVFTEQRLAIVDEVFGAEDEEFANVYFDTSWQAIFAEEHVPDKVTELDYSALENRDRLEIDQMVELGIAKAREVYEDPGSQPNLVSRVWRRLRNL